MLTYYTIDVNKGRKPVNGWVDMTRKIMRSDDMIMEFEVAKTKAAVFATAHPDDGVRILKHVETVEETW